MSARMRALWGLLLAAALLVGEEAPETVKFALAAGKPSENVSVGYGAARPIAVETARPRFVMEAPALRAADPLWFRVELGETAGVPFFAALDRSGPDRPHDLLWIDRDRDLDLANDGAPVAARLREIRATEETLVEFLGVELMLPYGEAREPYRCVIFYYSDGKKPPAALSVERDGWREGEAEVHGAKVRVVLLDDDGDGIFTTADSWAAGGGAADLLRLDATRTMTHPCWTPDGGFTLRVRSVDARGALLEVDVVKAAEAEKEYWLRVLRARQSEEERKLDIDPMRPKADPNARIDWLVERPLDRGLEIAERVSKRLVVEFFGAECEWCAKMARYTLRDREVVSLLDRFVAQRILYDPGAEDCRRLSVGGTPTYVLLEADGKEISRRVGFQKPQDFAAWLKSGLQ